MMYATIAPSLTFARQSLSTSSVGRDKWTAVVVVSETVLVWVVSVVSFIGPALVVTMVWVPGSILTVVVESAGSSAKAIVVKARQVRLATVEKIFRFFIANTFRTNNFVLNGCEVKSGGNVDFEQE